MHSKCDFLLFGIDNSSQWLSCYRYVNLSDMTILRPRVSIAIERVLK